MENKNAQRYLYFLFRSKSAVFLKETRILNAFNDYPKYEINSSNQNSFIDDVEEFINNNKDANKSFIVVNIPNITIDNQKKICSMAKDRICLTTPLPDNCKIVVIGNIDEIDKELLGLLVEIDV